MKVGLLHESRTPGIVMIHRLGDLNPELFRVAINWINGNSCDTGKIIYYLNQGPVIRLLFITGSDCQGQYQNNCPRVWSEKSQSACLNFLGVNIWNSLNSR